MRPGTTCLHQLSYRAPPQHLPVAPPVVNHRATPGPLHWLILHLLRETFPVSWSYPLNCPVLPSPLHCSSPDPQ